MAKTLLGCLLAFAFATLALAADPAKPAEPPKMPEPQKEHAWLQQLVGEWQADISMSVDPSQPPVKSKGSESVKALGGFWVLAENKGVCMDKPFTGLLTLGYDAEKKHYVGTWVDSMGGHLWVYEGTLDAAGKVLTLTSEGPCPCMPGKLVKAKDTLEIKDKDHKVFTSSMQVDGGAWNVVGTIDYRRVK